MYALEIQTHETYPHPGVCQFEEYQAIVLPPDKADLIPLPLFSNQESQQQNDSKSNGTKLAEQRAKFQAITEKLAIGPSLDGWYSVSAKQIQQVPNGAVLLKAYQNSPIKLLQAMHPEHSWVPWLFKNSTRVFWRSRENQQEFLNWIYSHLQLQSWKDLTRVSTRVFERLGGRPLLKRFGTSLEMVIICVFGANSSESQSLNLSAEAQEKLSLKKRTKGKFLSKEARIQFFKGLEQSLGVKTKEDWYQYTYTHIKDLGAKSLLDRYYASSLATALSEVYPNHDWLEWRFPQATRGFWNSLDNQRKFVEWYIKSTNPAAADSQEIFYDALCEIDLEKMRESGGGQLVAIYSGSLAALCCTLYPDHEWLYWQLQQAVPVGYWDKMENQRKYFDWLFKRLGLRNMSDWYNVSTNDIFSNRGSGLLSNVYSNNLSQALKAVYPEHPWQSWKHARAPTGHWRPEDTTS